MLYNFFHLFPKQPHSNFIFGPHAGWHLTFNIRSIPRAASRSSSVLNQICCAHNERLIPPSTSWPLGFISNWFRFLGLMDDVFAARVRPDGRGLPWPHIAGIGIDVQIVALIRAKPPDGCGIITTRWHRSQKILMGFQVVDWLPGTRTGWDQNNPYMQ